MQIQKINNYTNKYSSNKGQQAVTKNPNFGMKLVFDAEAISDFAGPDNVAKLEAVLLEHGTDASLVQRFKNVYAEVYAKCQNHFQRLPEPEEFNPNMLLDWDSAEVESFLDVKNGHVVVDLIHDKTSGIVASGASFVPDFVDGTAEALDHGLDDLARKLIYQSMWA